MSPGYGRVRWRGTGFRLKLLLAMMLVVSGLTVLALYVAQRNLTLEVASSLRRDFDEKLALLHRVQEVRHAALTERCRSLVRRPRIHAALEDNALDLLYPSAQDEMRDVLQRGDEHPDGVEQALQAELYRFLDFKGSVLPPPNGSEVGLMSPAEEAQLALPRIPRAQQLGYILPENGQAGNISEIIAVPIFSTETGEPIAALALGFKAFEFSDGSRGNRLVSGVWTRGKLEIPSIPAADNETLAREIAAAIASPAVPGGSLELEIAGIPHRAFFTLLNPGSLYPPAYEVCLFPLTDLLLRQAKLRWQILSLGGLMLLAGFAGSHYISGKLSLPVEKLAIDSETNRAHREQAEAALEQTSEELQRSARFSSDASHQLKTPVTVMRAGLEELLARADLNPDLRDEISDIIHQSFRLTNVVDDLLLLSRMDAGRLQLNLAPVDLSLLVETELDDLSAQPDDLAIEIDARVPSNILVSGEKRYTTMIVRNLLENARKYNRRGGKIRIQVQAEGETVTLSVANTGRGIPRELHERIFERFHRGAVGENVPGHGLGLNLARELARNHGGDLRLVRSDGQWTEFQVSFVAARQEVQVGI